MALAARLQALLQQDPRGAEVVRNRWKRSLIAHDVPMTAEKDAPTCLLEGGTLVHTASSASASIDSAAAFCTGQPPSTDASSSNPFDTRVKSLLRPAQKHETGSLNSAATVSSLTHAPQAAYRAAEDARVAAARAKEEAKAAEARAKAEEDARRIEEAKAEEEARVMEKAAARVRA